MVQGGVARVWANVDTEGRSTDRSIVPPLRLDQHRHWCGGNRRAAPLFSRRATGVISSSSLARARRSPSRSRPRRRMRAGRARGTRSISTRSATTRRASGGTATASSARPTRRRAATPTQRACGVVPSRSSGARAVEAATFLSSVARRSPVVCPSFSRPSLVVVPFVSR